MTIRPYKPEDYSKVSLWWKDHGFPIIPEKALPRAGFVAESEDISVSACWLYKDASAEFGFVTWVTSNPAAGPFLVARALGAMINHVKDYAKEAGILGVFTCTNHKLLGEYFQKNGFKMTSNGSAEMMWAAEGVSNGSS